MYEVEGWASGLVIVTVSIRVPISLVSIFRRNFATQKTRLLLRFLRKSEILRFCMNVVINLNVRIAYQIDDSKNVVMKRLPEIK